MAEKKTKDYIVIRGGMSLESKKGDCEIGSTVKLTDDQAAARVGKVQLKSEVAAESKVSENLEKENSTLKKKVAELEKQIEDLTAAMTGGDKKATK